MRRGATVAALTASTFALGVVVAALASAAAPAHPHLVVSLRDATLRLSQGRRQRTYAVGVGRSRTTPAGWFYTGRDPRDRRFYNPRRRAPAFYGGLPFLRLDLARGRHRGQVAHLYGLHGPVTPSLIWGPVSAGCLRLRAADIREIFAVARRHPRMRVALLRGSDPRAGSLVRRHARKRGCAEASAGVRRPRRLPRGARRLHGRVCGGVDQWYRVELQGGERIDVELDHAGALRVELYGIRAISTVAAGTFGLSHSVRRGRRNRGDRYLRVIAPRDGATAAYALRVAVR